MKKLARKFLAMLLTAAIAVSGLAVTGVTAVAKGMFDDAVEIEALELVSINFNETGDGEYYEIVLPKPGDITIRAAKANCKVILMDATGKEIESHTWCSWNGQTIYNCADDYKKLDKGKYYIYVIAEREEAFVSDLSYSFSPDKKATISFSTTLKKGDTLQLGSVTENYDGKVTWLSTKKSVATVSAKGLVTAKKAGTTYIRAQLDNGDYVEIKVVVKKK